MDDVFFLELKKRIDGALKEYAANGGSPPMVVLDLKDVKHIDSRGLGGLLLEADRLTSVGGRMKIVNAPVQVVDLMKLVGVDHFLEIEGNGRPGAERPDSGRFRKF